VPADQIAPADREAISLALRNLIDNALKYSPESMPVHVSIVREGSQVLIAIADEGPGIAASEQRDIFKKFVRGSAAADRRVKGTGIGLAMADHIVRAHGGQIRLRSEVGRGSTFTIAIPAPEAGEVSQAASFAEARSVKPGA
jgi:signal transduction histidine kinase